MRITFPPTFKNKTAVGLAGDVVFGICRFLMQAISPGLFIIMSDSNGISSTFFAPIYLGAGNDNELKCQIYRNRAFSNQM
ncbi:hypothetical protein C5L22_11895 [Pantoea ananatis]|nr:hypothetical protein C5L22_11895 [Pantoea ananatis]